MPPPKGAIARQTSADQAARYIRRLIFDADLRPHDRVPQDAVASVLGISRIPVREALIALEREGWVTIEPHRGAFVNALDEAAVRDHFELYGLTFGLAAQRAIERGVAPLVAALEPLVAGVREETDADRFSRLAVAFHDAVVAAAASPRIGVVLRAISTLVPGNFFALIPNAIPIEREGLVALLDAFRAGDPVRARDEYIDMMRRQADQVVTLFAARELFGERKAAAG
ncbi:MAG: transcriptional regulator, GntR family [Actinomycetia bacterium]|nr:transcriptional regulator, GntR family [Actinomycetes bacterium]